MKRQKLFFIALFSLAVFLEACIAQPAQENNPLRLISTISLPGVKGRIDHLSYDRKNDRLFIAALGNNSIEVVDLKNNKVIHSIKNLNEPQGVIFIQESNSIFVTNSSGDCDFFNADSFQKIAAIRLSGDADNIRYDTAEKLIYVGYGSGGIAIIDARILKLIAEIKLDGHPEGFQIDKTAKKIYVNIPDEKQIEILDLEKRIVIGKWKMTEAASNFPMSLDERNHRLFIGCRHSPKLLIIDTQTGKTVSSFEIDRDVDDIFYNNATKEIYISCGAGYVDVFKEADASTYTANGKVSTKAGARTSLFIPELNKLVVASPSDFGSHAQLLIYIIK